MIVCCWNGALTHAFLLTERLNWCSVTVVPGTKYSVKSPTRFPKMMFIRGRATPEAAEQTNELTNNRWSVLVPKESILYTPIRILSEKHKS